MRKATVKSSFHGPARQNTCLNENRQVFRRSPGYGHSFIDHSKYSLPTAPFSTGQPTSHASIQLQKTTSPASAAMTKTQFEQTVKQRFGVQKVAIGTFQDQMDIVTYHQSPIPGDLDQHTWRAWDPGSSSPVYEYIIDGFDAFAAGIGGLPPVRTITFFDVSYEREKAPVTAENPAGAVSIKKSGTGADYGGGSLNIYKVATQANITLPTGRSTGTKAATLPTATPEQSMKRVISHELGHGLQEAALTPDATGKVLDKDMVKNYGATIGWTSSGLYDIRETSGAVKKAIQDAKTPPAAFKITTSNWNDPKWQEQPISAYMVKESAFEDFGEGIMAYVHDPTTLKARSPLRYEFIDTHKSLWLPNLVQPKP